MNKISANEILNALVLLGYSLSEISKHTKITRVTLTKILKNNYTPAITVQVKLQDFYNKNIEEVELGKLSDPEFRNSCLINTPDGWQKGTAFVDKGLLHCYTISTKSGKISTAADNHYYQLNNNEWIYCKELKVGDIILTEDGDDEIISIVDAGELNCYDITINHQNHRYYLDGISSHNTGKSLLAALIIANALKTGYDHVFYFDSEGGATAQFFENVGADTDKIEQILVENVEDAQLKILEVYNGIQELKASIKEGEPEPRFLCVLDSLGALVAEKVLRDADKGKVTSEMGGRSKVVNNMVKALTIPALKTDTAMIILNHVYDDPRSTFFPEDKKSGWWKGSSIYGYY